MKALLVPTLTVLLALLILVPTPARSQETLTIGCAATLTGPAAAWGMGQVQFLEMLEEQINARGGLNVGGKRYLIKHISYDNKTSVEETIKILNKLIFEHKVKFIFGGSVGATCKGGQTVTAPNNVLWSFSCSGKELLAKDVPLNFRVYMQNWEQTYPFAAEIAKFFPKVKTMAALAPNDTSGWDGAKAEIAGCEKAGIKNVGEYYFERDQVDFHGILGKIMANKAGMISLGATPPGTAALILKQAYELGFRGPKYWLGGATPIDVLKICGAEAAEDTFPALVWDFNGKFTLPSLHDLVKRYEAKYGEHSSTTTLGQYCFMLSAFSVMEKIGSLDPIKVADALGEGGPYDTPFGPYMFGMANFYGGKPRQALHPCVLSVIRGGNLINLSYYIHPELKTRIGNWKFPE